MAQKHTHRDYEAELRELRERLQRMAGRVEEMAGEAVRALVEGDADRARRTIEADHRVNLDEIEIDALGLRILARRQPMASDLRFLVSGLKMVTDLERIGDLAVNVAERAIDLAGCGEAGVLSTAGEDEPDALADVERMGTLVRSGVTEALEAFGAEDAERARGVIAWDDEVDRLYERIFRDLLARMARDPDALLEIGIHLQSAAKFLERIGDHATNLAEDVIYMVRGQDVRHAGKLPEGSGG